MSTRENDETCPQRETDLGRCTSQAGGGKILLYTRSGCHLCEDAKLVLEKYRAQFGLTIVEVDIDQDAAIEAAYDCWVPVVEIDGKVRFRGQVNEALLLRLLRSGPH